MAPAPHAMKTILRRFLAAPALLAALFAAPAAFATPTISFVTPTSGSTIASAITPASVTVTVTAAPTAGSSIVSVQFSVNGVSIGSAAGSSPFSVNWVPTSSGAQTIAATITDTSAIVTGASASTNTATVNSFVTVTTARGVILSTTAPSSTVAQGSQLFLRANAFMSDAIVGSVSFLVDGTAIPGAAVIQPPFNSAVTLSAANGFTVGAHTLTATATASDGVTTVTSAGVALTIATPVSGNIVPTASITAPSAGASVTVGGNVTVTATATDSDGFIPSTAGAGVTFFVDGDPISPVGTGETNPKLVAPYSLTWKPTVTKSYSLRAQTVDNQGAVVLSPAITVNVVGSVPTPTVSLTAPANGSTVSVGATVPLTATAGATGGATVTKVDFLVAGTVVGTVTSASGPYSVNWIPSAAGSTALTARVTDSNGSTTTSATVTVTVAASAPTVAITLPANGAVVPLGTSTTLTATATGNGGATVNRVDFLAGATIVGTALAPTSGSSYTFNWAPSAAGITALTAKATDSNGATTTSTIVNVNVTGPSISLTAPSAGTSVTAGAEVTLTATPTVVAPATVTKVDFFAGATLVGTANSSPYAVNWTTTTAGAFSITARVTDSNTATATSSAVSVTVTASAPSISLTAPANGASVGLSSTVPLTATSTASTGATVTRVDFLVGATTVGTALAPSSGSTYGVNWIPTTTGIASLTAKVTDSSGATITSSAINVTVTAPSVTLTAPVASSSVATGAVVSLAATATAVGSATVSKVDFFAGATLVGTATTGAGSTYTITWTPTTTGTISLTARVTDSNTAAVTSAAVSVTVAASAPTISLTAPANGASVGLSSSVPLTATATASNGATVTRVDFLAGATNVGTALAPTSGSTYGVNWTPTTAGISALTAKVTDSTGATATSAAINVTVTSPTVALTSPVGGTPVNIGVPVTLTANATAVAATVTKVDFLAGTTLVGTDSTGTGSTYTVNWTPTTTGNISLTARVTDSNGAAITSSAVTVPSTIALPTVTITAPTGGSALGINSPVTLSATAVAGSGATVARVDFLVGGATVGSSLVPTSGSSFSVSWTPTTAAVDSLTAKVTDSNGNTATSSAVIVTVSAASVALTAPTTGSTANVGVPVTLTATASTVGTATVTKVDFFAGATLVGTATSAPYTATWTPTAVATVSLTARVTDSNNATATSAVVSVTVGASTGPSVGLTLSPNTAAVAGSATLPFGAVRNILATVIPAPGTAIISVAFFIDGSPASGASVDSLAPYVYRYVAPASAGTHVFSAVATDNAGNTGTALFTLTVVSSLGAPPTINLLAPTNGATVVPNTSVGLAASALAPGGTVASVQFFANGSPAGINGGNALTASPYVSAFTPTQPGTYVIDAIATDDRGNTTVSNSVTITAAFSTPTVAITAPTSSSNVRVTPNVPFNITATATAGTGASVLLVEFLLDGTQIGTRTAPTAAGGSSYTFTWTPTTAQLGAHALTARVTDTNSLSTTSAPAINLTVANVVGTPPTVTISSPTGTAAASIQTLSTVNFVANAFATGANNNLTSVEFFINDVSIGLATREQATNLYRLAYNFGAYDFSQIVPTTPDVNGNTRYPLALYAIAKDTNGNQTISTTANLIITQSTSVAPTVSLQATGLTTVTQNTPVQVTANAVDPDGTVVSLQLFVNGVSSGAAVANPAPQATLTYTPTVAGKFNLYVTATDDTGNVAVSSPPVVITVTAIIPPTVTAALTKPVDDTTVTNIGSLVFLEATASSSDPTQLPTVTFVATGSNGARTTITNAQRQGTTTTYRATWAPTVADTYTISCSATAGAGAAAVTATSTVSHRVLVNSVTGIAPVVSITGGYPTNVTTASTANFTATATDSDGAVSGVEFFFNRTSIGQAVRDQLNNTWRITASFSGLSAGTYDIVAIARDNSGNLTASSTGTAPTINVTAPFTSPAPSITVFASPVSLAVGQSVVLTASASSSAPFGFVTGIQYYANGTFLAGRTTPGAYQFTWTNATSGTYNVYAIATDSAGNTTVSPSVQVNVRPFNPVSDNDAFVLQSYVDVSNVTSPNLILAASYSAQLTAGTLTRGQLISTLTNDNGFAAPTNILAAYYILMGQWPTLTNYQLLLPAARSSLANAIGTILASPEYIAKYPEHLTPTVALLENPKSVIPATTFEARIWANAGLGHPSPANDVAFRNNPTATLTLGRGYNVAGLNAALAEFITNTNSTNTAFDKLATAAALYYQLDQPPLATSTDDIATRISALAKLADIPTIATAVLQDQLYLYRYVTITTQPQSVTVATGANATFSVVAVGLPPLAYQWLFNGSPIAGANTSTLSLTRVDSTKAGAYSVLVNNSVGTATSQIALLGVTSTGKVTGSSRQVAANVVASNGNVYDQVLLQGDSTTITADAGKITRLSYIDLTNDIVQVEFSGAGSLSIMLDNSSGPAAPLNYNQPDVAYMKGHAGIVISGANETTNVSVFSVGRTNAVNQGLFKSGVTYDGIADLGYIVILSANGKFGGLRTANANYFATSGFAGVYAPGVEFNGPVYVGDISAADDATPVFLLGSADSDTWITGGDLLQMNGQPVRVSGITRLQFKDGTTSQGVLLPAQTNKGHLEQNNIDVTDQLVVNPASSP